ncbi:MAG: carotenoid oxygenase family protein [Acidimicrobiia bacterium]|nr:carotenoid oxygenase family protein [Acidimicrobiia bacterium]
MTAADTTNAQLSYVEGSLAPVAEELTLTDLDVSGSLPADLCGRYVRNGPNPIGADPAAYHWFTGYGMVHGVRLEDGEARWYRNRYVRTAAVSEALGEAPIDGPQPPEGAGASVNTNVIRIAGRTLALVEAGAFPIELSEDLTSVGGCDFDGTLMGAYTAHPAYEPAARSWHAMTYFWPEEGVRYLVVGPEGRVTHNEFLDLGERIMLHDTALTSSRVLVFDMPVTFNVEAAMSGATFPYRWNPERPARVGAIPLRGSADEISWCEVPQCYVFHSANARDLDGDRVSIDVVRWPRMFDTDPLGPNEGVSTLERWVLDFGRGRATTEVLDDRMQEFPRYDYRRSGTENRHAYAIAMDGAVRNATALLCHDLVAGTTAEVSFGPGTAPHEFVFVPRAGAAADDETDGWLVGYVSDRAAGTTDLVVVGAADPGAGPVARVHIPARIPDGFHGNWISD